MYLNVCYKKVVNFQVILIDVLSLFQQFGKIIDVEIIFNERGSKVRITATYLNHHCHIEKKITLNIYFVKINRKKYILNFDIYFSK